jgi:xanthine dehydrogenase accessory factor
MLIYDDGTFVGAVSGGCLEADIVGHAMKAMHSGDALTVTYDTSATEEDVWGLNLGCSGVVQILIETLPGSAPASHMAFLSDCLSMRKTGVIASIFRVDGELKATVGSHLALTEEGRVQEDIKHPVLTAAITEDCVAALRSKSTFTREYRFTEGTSEALIEFVSPPITMFVFGAGADSIPLVRMAKGLGWIVNVIDHRQAYLSRERFALADELCLARPEEISASVRLNPDSAAVILTHNFSHDTELLRALMPSPVSYIGLLGPAKRSAQLLDKLKESGFVPTPDQRTRLHAPVGLNIGAETPEEMALSILAEIQAHFTKRAGGFLRDYQGPIHS